MSMSNMSSMTMSSSSMAGMSSTTSGMTMATGTSGMMMGGMIFSTQNTAVHIFSNAFSPVTEGQYVGAWFFCFFLAVIWRALILLMSKLDQYWIRKYSARCIKVDGG